MKDWLAHFPLTGMPRLTHIGYRAHQSPHIGKLHTHFGYEIKLITNGSAVLQLTEEKKTIRVAEGDLLIVPPGFIHWSTMRSGFLSYFWFGIQTGAVISRASSSEIPVPKRGKRTKHAQEKSIDRVLAPLDARLPPQWMLLHGMHEIAAPMRSMHDEIAYPRTANEAIVYAQTIEVLARIVRRLSGADTAGTDPILETEAYIRSHFLELPPLTKLAAVSGLNRSYLCRSFRKRFGVSPIAYTNRLRLRHGMALLATGMSVIEAARLCGYGNSLHFSAVFRKKTGTSPTEYKAQTQLLRTRVR